MTNLPKGTDSPKEVQPRFGKSNGQFGKAFVYGDDVDTDRLFPGRYLFVADPAGMRKYALEDLDPTFRERVRQGDLIVGGRNFGCGSSREQAVACLLHSGVRTVIARTFARIYYRNAINNGVAPLVCPGAVDGIRDGDQVTVDLAAGTITNLTRDEAYRFEPLPDFLLAILDDGGLVPHLRKRFATAAPPVTA
ncbi:MAG TPA: 3-isopropylmalate dehydratase small subunit [Candidatus Thermoplasmatota archaeon]|nr:3-isopropylmalate dehydratase small subunit [Candidatus Thermoplasmatota archaeon]